MSNKYERLEPRFFENEYSIPNYVETVMKQIVKRDDEATRQAIKDYVRIKYPNGNARIDFLDEEVVNEIIDLGISEYLRRHT